MEKVNTRDRSRKEMFGFFKPGDWINSDYLWGLENYPFFYSSPPCLENPTILLINSVYFYFLLSLLPVCCINCYKWSFLNFLLFAAIFLSAVTIAELHSTKYTVQQPPTFKPRSAFRISQWGWPCLHGQAALFCLLF